MAEVEKKESNSEDTEGTDESVKDSQGDETVGEGSEESEGSETTSSPAKSKKKLIAIVLAVVLLSGGGIGITLMKKKKEAEEQAKLQEQQASKKPDPIFHDMDEMIINLNTEGKGVSFMKLKITLEVSNSDNLEQVKKMMPKITDVFQMYLRELRPSDMQGSVGLYRLKEELLLRINKIIYPSQISDILFNEVLVQ